MGELIFMAVLTVFTVGMFLLSGSFQTSLIDKSGGPALFPRIVIAFLLAFMALRAWMVVHSEEERVRKFTLWEMFRGSRLFYLVILALYAMLIKPLGFVISTWLFCLIMIPFLYRKQCGNGMNKKQLGVTAAVVIVGVFCLYYVFTEYFHVLLPAGILKV